jgi:hypothetical protein
LGRDAATTLLNKVDRMARAGATATQIEKAFVKHLSQQMQRQTGKFMSIIEDPSAVMTGLRTLVSVHAKK